MDNWLVFETVTYTHKVTAETEEEAIKIVKGGGQGQESYAYQKSALLLVRSKN